MATLSDEQKIKFYGYTPVARDPDVLFKDHPTASGENPRQDLFKFENFSLPDSPLVRKVKQFVKTKLNEQTFNHSNRVYIYGRLYDLGTALVKTHFPDWTYDSETYYLICLLHDVGTADDFLATTKMSFEFKGAIVARELLLANGGVEDQADSVCEAIIRHQDIFAKGGNITMIGQIIQLATILDNVGIRANLIHPDLIATTCAAFPRKNWSECFACTIEKELALKPWCHTSTFEQPNWADGIPSNFATDVRANSNMDKYGKL